MLNLKCSAVFDKSCRYWTTDRELNLMFLRNQETYYNYRLMAYGRVTLGEIADILGIRIDDQLRDCGWTYVKENPSGDNYIDFGLYDAINMRYKDLPDVILEFNVDECYT